MKDKETQNKVFDILDKMEFFQGQRAGRELWNDKPKEVQDKDISDFIKDINYIRSYLQDSVVLSKEEYEDYKKHVDNCVEEYHRGQHEAELYYKNIQIPRERKETAEKLLNDFKLWAREYQYKDTVVDENGERPMTNNEKLNYLYTYLCDKYKVEIKEYEK